METQILRNNWITWVDIKETNNSLRAQRISTTKNRKAAVMFLDAEEAFDKFGVSLQPFLNKINILEFKIWVGGIYSWQIIANGTLHKFSNK